MEGAALSNKLFKTGDFDAYIWSVSSGPDPLQALNRWHTRNPRSGGNLVSYSNPAFDRLVDQAAGERDAATPKNCCSRPTPSSETMRRCGSSTTTRRSLRISPGCTASNPWPSSTCTRISPIFGWRTVRPGRTQSSSAKAALNHTERRPGQHLLRPGGGPKRLDKRLCWPMPCADLCNSYPRYWRYRWSCSCCSMCCPAMPLS